MNEINKREIDRRIDPGGNTTINTDLLKTTNNLVNIPDDKDLKKKDINIDNNEDLVVYFSFY